MSKRDGKLLVGDILEAADKILRWTVTLERDQFLDDEKTRDAVVRNLEIIGEAASQMPEEIKINNPHVPWRQIIGLRHRIAHGYFGVDYELIWNIVRSDLPSLQEQVAALLLD